MKIFTVLLAFAAALLLTCTLGTGSEVEGRCAIEGRAVDSHGDPVAGAKVRVRPVGFLALYADEFSAFDTVTDKNGFYRFDTIPVDSYTIEINKDGKTGALQELMVAGYDSFPIVLPTDTLTPTGTIYGRINLPMSDDTARPWVALYNVDYIAAMPLTQDFRFAGVPEGVYRLRIVPYRESKLVVELHDVSVAADSVTDVGTLNFTIQQFFKGCMSRECDSMAVRSILDANGYADLPVDAVISTDGPAGRCIGLDLSAQSIITLPKDIGSLSRLELLDLRNNRLASLPEQVGYLQSLRECHLDSNELYDLPFEFSYLCSLQVLTATGNNLYRFDARLMRLPVTTLDLRGNMLEKLPDANQVFPNLKHCYLDNNELQSLPATIIRLKPAVFSVGNNRLCAMPSALSKWLTSYDEDWNTSQDCPKDTLPR